MDATAWVSGAIAGQTSLLLVQPLDVIRTKLQTSTKQQYKGPIDCFVKTLKKDGVPGFYRGILAPFFAQGLYKSIMFGSFHNSSNFFRQYNAKHYNISSTSLQAALSPIQLLMCGSFSGIINSFIVTPVELIRNRLIVNTHQQTEMLLKPTISSVIRDVYNQHGVFGMWKGQLSCSLRDCVGVGAYFYGNTRAVTWMKQNYPDLSNSVIQLVGGMIAGICFWTFSLPLDRIKSIIQTQVNQNIIDNLQSTTINTPPAATATATTTTGTHIPKPKGSFAQLTEVLFVFNNIIRTEGIRGLYRGYSVGVGRGIPAGAVTFFVNNQMLQLFERRKQHQVQREVQRD